MEVTGVGKNGKHSGLGPYPVRGLTEALDTVLRATTAQMEAEPRIEPAWRDSALPFLGLGFGASDCRFQGVVRALLEAQVQTGAWHQ